MEPLTTLVLPESFNATTQIHQDTSFVINFTNKLRSLAKAQYPANVPKNVDRHFFFTVGLGTIPCLKTSYVT
ncbi:Laccase-4, partial [Bienertia sinuspersici]